MESPSARSFAERHGGGLRNGGAWPGPGKEVMVFCVGSPKDGGLVQKNGGKSPRRRPAASLRAPLASTKDPSLCPSSSSQSRAGAFRSSSQGRLGSASRQDRPKTGGRISLFTCDRPFQQTTTFLTWNSTPALPSLLSVYRAKTAEARVEPDQSESLVANDLSLPSLQKSLEPSEPISAPRPKLPGPSVGAERLPAAEPPKPRVSEKLRKTRSSVHLAREKKSRPATGHGQEAPLPAIAQSPSANVVASNAQPSDDSLKEKRRDRAARPWARGMKRESVVAVLQETLEDEGSPTSISKRMSSTDIALLRFETTDEQIERSAFQRLAGSTNRELPCDQVIPCLQLMGYRDVRASWVQQICAKLVPDRSSLSLENFQELVEMYHTLHLEELVAEYEEADLDKTGHIGAAEITILLERHGITVLPGIVRELLHEIKDDPQASLAGIDDYVCLREIIQYRGGFTKREVEKLKTLYARYDEDPEDHNGRLRMSELETALKWLGFSVPTGEDHPGGIASDLMQGLDTKAFEVGLTFEDFLQVMRRRREWEIKALSEHFSEHATNLGIVSIEGIVKILRALGYDAASPGCIQECAAKNKLGTTAESFYFEGMWLILKSYQDCEGFLIAEIENFRHVFQTYDWDGSGAIGVVELGGALRSMGYRAGLEDLQGLMDAVDLDKSGEIDFDEFLKIMRLYREEELHAVERGFRVGDLNGNNKLCSKEIRCLLPALGYSKLSDEQNRIVEATSGKELDFRQALDLLRRMQVIEGERFREHQGYTEKELKTWQQRYSRACGRQKQLSEAALRTLVTREFTELVKDDDEREAVDEMLKSHGARFMEGSNFLEFLEFVRMIQDRDSHKAILQEDEVAIKQGFSRGEVRDFRKMYKLLDCDASRDRAVAPQELLRLFTAIVPSTESTTAELRSIIAKVSNGKGPLKFTDFLEMIGAVKELVPESAL